MQAALLSMNTRPLPLRDSQLTMILASTLRYAVLLALAGGLCFGQEKEKEKQTPPQTPQETKPAEVKPEGAAEPKLEGSGAAAAVDPKSYIIGVQDVVGVTVWRETELSRMYTVRPDGKISMPLAGDIDADGITPEKLKDRIVTALSVYMNRPEVIVEIRQINSKRYFISGEINKPGPYALTGPVTVLEAISNAGGLREFANGKKIVIMRGDERLKFNYKDVIKGKNMDQNIQISNGDHIIVP